MVDRIGDALSENATVVEADQFAIKAVKLFQGSDTAEVTRKFPLSFLRSQNEHQVVEIVHLPSSIQSVDVSVTSTSGNVTIVDHYRTSAAQLSNSVVSSQTLREFGAERRRLEDEKNLREQSFSFLRTYMDSLARCKSQGQPEAAQMVTFFDEYIQIGATRSAAIAELQAKLTDIDNKIFEETQRLAKLKQDLPVKVIAVLSCDNHVPVEAAELVVTYVVKQVNWKPSYDVHVAMSGNIPSPIVKIEFRCTVKQWTGENWENISLAVTTADQISQLIRLPEPKGINISLGPTNVFGQTNHISMAPMAPMAVDPDSYDVAKTPEQVCRPKMAPHARLMNAPQPFISTFSGTAPPPPPQATPPAREAQATSMASVVLPVSNTPSVDTSSQRVSQFVSNDGKDPTTHVANGSIFIPSDQAEHHVLVASLPLQAEFMRVVVPSIDTRVYHTCEIKNTSGYVLLPGTVKTYLNDKHVSSTEIHSTDLPQTLECSLAVDTGVKTIHNRAPDALPSVTAFTGKATTTYTSATVIHNMHTEVTRGIIVRSSIPLPADPRITIVLKEPAGLAEIDEGSVSVKEGCLARWSTTGGRKGKQVGLFEWVCDMNPGTEVLKAVWEVCAPQNLKLLERERN